MCKIIGVEYYIILSNGYNILMMWTDFIDVMNFIFIANDMWMLWTAFILGGAFIWKIKK